MTSDFRIKALSAVKWTATSMLLRAAFAVAQLVILARLLRPEELGLVAITLSILSLVVMVSDLGLSSATIHFQDIGANQRSTLYWINLAIAAALTLALAVLSWPIAGFFGEPALAPMIMVGSCIFVVTAIGQQLRALAEKELRFRALAATEITSGAVGFVGTIVAASAGLGAYSVVLGTLLTALVASTLAWPWLSDGWRPRRVLELDGIGKYIRYGLQVIGINFIGAIGLQGDVIVAARLFASGSLGHYFPPREIGVRIMMVINPIITRVGFPLIAQLQSDRRRAGVVYRETILMSASVNFPIYGALALFAPQLVDLLFGPGWEDSAPLMRALGVWCAARSIGNPVGSMLMGLGETRRAIVASSIVSGLVLICATLGGVTFGLVGVPYALAVLYVALIIPFWALLVHPACGLGFWSYHMQLLRPLACTLLAMVAGWSAGSVVEGSLLQLAAGGIAGGLVYAVSSGWLNRGWLYTMLHLFGAAGPPKP